MNSAMPSTALSTADAILDAFATAGTVLPRDALKQARDHWPEVGPLLLRELEQAAHGGELTDRAIYILFFGLFLMAQVRETRAFRPLCALAADRERIETVLADAITEDLSGFLARTYDGDPAPLRALIENADADEYVRAAALDALALLTLRGRIDRDETGRYLRALHATLQPQDTNFVWVSWQQAVALLGYEDLVPLVEDAFARGWIDETIMDVSDFRKDLRDARELADPLKSLPVTVADPDRYDDIEARMLQFAAFRPKKTAVGPPPPRWEDADGTVHNPYRGIGRNDPCPCGSGKKFKKCCLNLVRDSKPQIG
jgi:hypothetical protein